MSLIPSLWLSLGSKGRFRYVHDDSYSLEKEKRNPQESIQEMLGEKPSLVKCSMTHKSEDLSLILNAPVQSWMWQSICNSSAQRQTQLDPWGMLVRDRSLIGELQAPVRKPYLKEKNKVDKCVFLFMKTSIHLHINTHHIL